MLLRRDAGLRVPLTCPRRPRDARTVRIDGPPPLRFSFSLESYGLSAAGCEDLSSAPSSSDRLTHLCLADNVLGDGGVSLLRMP